MSDNVFVLSNDPRYRRSSERAGRPRKSTVCFVIPGKPAYTGQVQLPVTLEVGATFPFGQALWRVTDVADGGYRVRPVVPNGQAVVPDGRAADATEQLGGEPEAVAVSRPAPKPTRSPALGAKTAAKTPPASATGVEARLYPTIHADRLLVCWDVDGAVVTVALTPTSPEFAEAKRRIEESLGRSVGHLMVGEADPTQPRMVLEERRALELAAGAAAAADGREKRKVPRAAKPRRSKRAAPKRSPKR